MPRTPPLEKPSAGSLPPPRIEIRSHDYRTLRCPRCGHLATRYGVARRLLHDLGGEDGRPVDLAVVYSKHRCRHCGAIFTADLSGMAARKSRYTHRVHEAAVRLVLDDRLSFRAASMQLAHDRHVFVPWATIQNWVEAERLRRRGRPRAG